MASINCCVDIKIKHEALLLDLSSFTQASKEGRRETRARRSEKGGEAERERERTRAKRENESGTRERERNQRTTVKEKQKEANGAARSSKKESKQNEDGKENDKRHNRHCRRQWSSIVEIAGTYDRGRPNVVKQKPRLEFWPG